MVGGRTVDSPTLLNRYRPHNIPSILLNWTKDVEPLPTHLFSVQFVTPVASGEISTDHAACVSLEQ